MKRKEKKLDIETEKCYYCNNHYYVYDNDDLGLCENCSENAYVQYELEHKQEDNEDPQIEIKEEKPNEKNGKKSFWQRIKKRKK